MNEIKEQFAANPLLWGKFYFTNHFRAPSPAFHLQLLHECIKNKYLAVASPRGSSKSTLLSFLIPIHALAFNKVRFAVIVSNTYKKASGALENIKKEIRENAKFRNDFPLVIRRDAEGDSIFKHPDGTETRILCKGNEQIGSVRGEKFGANRPDLIIVDDVEDDELVKNPERRKALQDVFDEALIPALDITSDFKVIVIGTILHDDSLMAKLVSPELYPEFCKLFYQARERNTDGSYISLWPEKWSLEMLAELEIIKPDVFAKEYQNDPVSGSMQVFHKEDFRYWRIENDNYILFDTEGNITSKGSMRDCRGAIACDLAWEEDKSADFSVAMPGYLTPNSDLLIDNYIHKRGLRPNEMEEILYSMRDKVQGLTGTWCPVGFEKAKIEKVSKWFLVNAGRRRNDPLLFKDLQWGTDKIERIQTKLQPRYIQHMVYHRHGMGELEHQLTRFPSATHDDLPDAEQGLVQLLQYPKGIRKEVASDSEFDWWRKKAIEAHTINKRKRYVYGNKGKGPNLIPATESYR
jgi:hypothetical protein